MRARHRARVLLQAEPRAGRRAGTKPLPPDNTTITSIVGIRLDQLVQGDALEKLSGGLFNTCEPGVNEQRNKVWIPAPCTQGAPTSSTRVPVQLELDVQDMRRSQSSPLHDPAWQVRREMFASNMDITGKVKRPGSEAGGDFDALD